MELRGRGALRGENAAAIILILSGEIIWTEQYTSSTTAEPRAERSVRVSGPNGLQVSRETGVDRPVTVGYSVRLPQKAAHMK